MVLIPFVLLNCFVEEAIVRAYLMTELSELTGSMVLAGVVSVAIQVSYHTYQGWLPATGHIATFAVFSFYYARKRKLLPLYVGHVLIDLFAVAYLLFRWRSH
jgi:membrane protease YdiL (CAAX protease family)